MIIKCNITGIPSIRLTVSSKVTQQLHVNRKIDKFGRRVSTSWVTSNTEVSLSRYHANKNNKDVDGLIYVGRAFQQYMDKFDQEFGFRLAGSRAFAKFFETNGKSQADAANLAVRVMEEIIANKDKATIIVSDSSAPSKKAVAADAAPAKAKKRTRKTKVSESESVKSTDASKKSASKAKVSESGSAKSSVAPKKRGRPRKMAS